MGGWAHRVLALFKQVVIGGLDFRVTPGSVCLPEFQRSLESFRGQGQCACACAASLGHRSPGPAARRWEPGVRCGAVRWRTGPAKALGQAWGRGGPRSAGRQVPQKQNHLKHLIWASRGPCGQVPHSPGHFCCRNPRPVRVATGWKCPERRLPTCTLHRVWDG